MTLASDDMLCALARDAKRHIDPRRNGQSSMMSIAPERVIEICFATLSARKERDRLAENLKNLKSQQGLLTITDEFVRAFLNNRHNYNLEPGDPAWVEIKEDLLAALAVARFILDKPTKEM